MIESHANRSLNRPARPHSGAKTVRRAVHALARLRQPWPALELPGDAGWIAGLSGRQRRREMAQTVQPKRGRM